jgi:two-component system, LuxR family, response regulator FixJ
MVECREAVAQGIALLLPNLQEMTIMSPSPGAIAHIVDDDEFVRDSTIALLRAAGITCRAYASGDAFLRDRDPSAGGCVLLDLHMPGQSGFQVLKDMRKTGKTLPVILFSGRTDLATEELARKSGAAVLLSKPAAPAELVGWVRQLLAEKDQG